ncbi:transforming acidic coiled-coil-containing protein 2 isoform X2 [Drosophila bipectinata]|uniref:transforming acidic coiled-coil-containing protein 2 isoform X2 n=1 Tax=Drosophila bipectinata TaxID=42026 RepID=UPI0038B38C89
MDFFANIIKRPLSVARSGSHATTMEAAQAPTDATPKEGAPLVSTDLGSLLDSASEDLMFLEEQHSKMLLEPIPLPIASPVTPPTSSRDSIQKLLSEINVNLNQVSANEMEHLQAMSGELNPLAVKASPKPVSTDQQKALAAATGGIKLDVDATPKFGGLPEYDETQIPDVDAHLKSDHSSSDVFVECLSLHAERYSGDRSDLEAYSSALNDVLEHQMSSASAATLENTFDDPLAVSQNDVSYEPMDVDEVNETMEMLKNVLDPEDHQLLQQQFLVDLPNQEVNPVQIEPVQETLTLPESPEPVQETVPLLEAQSAKDVTEMVKEEPGLEDPPITPQETETKEDLLNEKLPIVGTNTLKEDQQSVQLPEQPEPKELNEEILESQPLQIQNIQEHLEENTELEQEIQKEQASVHEQPEPLELQIEIPNDLGSSLHNEPESSEPQENPVAPMPSSPPIPTHRPKTAEELEYLALQALPLPDEEAFDETHKIESPKEKEEIKNMEPSYSVPVVQVTTTPPKSTTPTEQESGSDMSAFRCRSSGPHSPTFPIKGPSELPAHFPHSPHAPPESEEMPYLEEAVVEPSADRKQSVCEAGVIARSPVSIKVTQASPEMQEHLNETLPISEVVSPTPLNGTFEAAPLQASTTFAVSLGSADEQQRRTFSVIQSTDEPEETKSRRTFCLDPNPDVPRRTFSVEQHASPALEATEENIVGDELEPMDVDSSMRVEETTVDRPPVSTSPPIPTHQNLRRAPIHTEFHSPSSPRGNATVVLEEQALSAKEQATLSASDEKDDVFVEHFGAMSPVSDDMFKTPQFTSSGFQNQAKMKANAAGPSAALNEPTSRNRDVIVCDEEQFYDAEFQDSVANQNLILNSSDFDYLYTKGSNNAPIDRSSLLLKFDPLLGAPVPVNHPQQQEQALLNILGSNPNQAQNRALSPTLEEHETSGGNQSFGVVASAKDTAKKLEFKPPVDRTKKHAKMSVDVIDNDCNKTFDNSNLNSEDKSHTYNNMDELEKKIKNEVTRSEDIEKKLKEAEQREEALIKRITEKDKTNAKLNGVIEAYEKAIAELISEKEQLAQGYERQLQEVQTDRDANYHHLTSLESTFSDLHVKYEKSKQMTSQLKTNEEALMGERKQLMDNLRLQEQRYDKMKSHAMQQLEIANKKLDTYSREHADEVKKLKALLKKEEVSRVSMTEQLQQKSRENADLLKICEELIYGKGQDF